MNKKMNTIEKLIAALCPEGVVFKELGDALLPKANIRWQSVGNQTFHYIDLTSVDRVTHRISETQTINAETAPSRAQQIVKTGDVIFGTTRPTLKRFSIIDSNFDGQICSTGFCVLRPDTNKVLTNYIYHLIGSSDFFDYVEVTQKGASYPAISDSAVKQFKIPIPPLAIQQEIVKILDTFTTLEAELEAELEARKKQYEYYRDELLTFGDDACLPDRQVERKTLGEVGSLIRGNGLQKKDFVEDGVGCIHYGQIYTYYGTYADKTKTFVSSELAIKLKKAKKGDVLISGVSENIEDVCKPLGWLGDEICISGDMFAFRHNQNTKFITYSLQTTNFKRYKERFAQGAKVIRVKQDKILSYKIPIPPPRRAKPYRRDS